MAASLILAALAQAAAAAGSPSVITMPDWMRLPSAEDMARFYPRAAADAGLGGRATIACAVTAQGTLDGCQVLQEDPVGAGFGQAALSISPLFQMRPMTKDGAPVSGGKVRIPIRFALPAPTVGAGCPAAGALLYPQRALANGVSGSATLQCTVGEGGRMSACKVLEEKPAGEGFGAVAVTQATCSVTSRLQPGSEITFPLDFKHPGRR